MLKYYDAIIMGGGINGCAIARKLAADGKKVCLLERHKIGSGTSSNSSKLIHGGLRYLETGRFGLVRESLKDRMRLARLYPNLVEMVPFYLPIYNDSLRPWWMIRTGLGLYDILSGQPRYHGRHVGIDDFSKKFPAIKRDGLRKVFVYYDGKTNDLEITRQIARDALNFGCVVREGCQVTTVNGNDESVRVSYQDERGTSEAAAPLLINATGPWIDEVNQQYGLPHNYCINKVSGIHIVVDKMLVPDCMFLQTRNKRIFFMIPWESGKTIIGTTERLENCKCDQVQVQENDIDYLLVCANHYLRTRINREDICDTFLGIRPIVKDKSDSPDATNMSREYKIDVISKGKAKLIHVYGGKLTTCLSMAEKVAARV